MVIANLRDKLRRYFWFSPVETRNFLVAVFVISFVYSFDKWGVAYFDAAAGMKNWLIGFILFGAILFVHHAGQRIAAIHFGFQPEHLVWWYGLVLSLLLALLSNGVIKIYAVTGLTIHMLPVHRLWRFRYGPNVQAFANITALGLVANICAAALLKTLSLIVPLPQAFIDEWFVQNLIFVAWNLLPIPPLDGSRIIYGSRLFYVFVFGTFLGYLSLALIGIYSFVLALVAGGVAWFLFYYFVERG